MGNICTRSKLAIKPLKTLVSSYKSDQKASVKSVFRVFFFKEKIYKNNYIDLG